jgi:hypothetical protein
VQVRVFRQEDGLFTVVTHPRKRYGVAQVTAKDLRKAEIVALVAREAAKEDAIREAVRAARDALRQP